MYEKNEYHWLENRGSPWWELGKKDIEPSRRGKYGAGVSAPITWPRSWRKWLLLPTWRSWIMESKIQKAGMGIIVGCRMCRWYGGVTLPTRAPVCRELSHTRGSRIIAGFQPVNLLGSNRISQLNSGGPTFCVSRSDIDAAIASKTSFLDKDLDICDGLRTFRKPEYVHLLANNQCAMK